MYAQQVPFAYHTACTIEIANLTVDYDVAVIDEIIRHCSIGIHEDLSVR
jgi:hypothetical protein